jgi:glucosamine kinase
MIIIADSGSTKTDWCLINTPQPPRYFTTEGYNPYFVDAEYIIDSIKKSLPGDIDLHQIETVYFYGAGCQDDNPEMMVQILRGIFPVAKEVHAEVDLLGAARGLLGNQPGFAAILGTGTNTCLYDGTYITQNIDSLGFLLGDEGSGASIGKNILSDFLRQKMPPAVLEVFIATYGLSAGEVMQMVYSNPMPNRFCAGFARFLTMPGIDPSYTHHLVKNAFESFFQQLVSAYPAYKQYPFNCVGSVGFYFRDILKEVTSSYGMSTGRITPTLIEDLVQYHITLQQPG